MNMDLAGALIVVGLVVTIGGMGLVFGYGVAIIAAGVVILLIGLAAARDIGKRGR